MRIGRSAAQEGGQGAYIGYLSPSEIFGDKYMSWVRMLKERKQFINK